MTAHAEVKSGALPVREETMALAQREERPSLARIEGEPSPMQLMQLALERGASVDQLKELHALSRQMDADHARKLFFRALAAFQADVGPIKKNKTANVTSERTGSQFGYTWASLDEIDRVIRPLLTKNGLSYTWNEEQEGSAITIICIVRHEAGHHEPTHIKLNIGGSPGMSEHQKVASTIQFGRRQSLTSALGLSTTDDVPDIEHNQEKINEDQAIVITDLLTETRTSPSRFLKHFQIGKVEDLRAIDYDVAVASLTDKKKAVAK